MAALHERVDALEASFDHLRDGIDTVSADLRALTHETRTEIVPRLDRIDGRLAQMDGRMDRIDGRMDRMDGRLGQIDGRMERMDGRMDRMERSMAALLAHFDIADPNSTADPA